MPVFAISGLCILVISLAPNLPEHPAAAILNEPDLPIRGAASSPETLAALLKGAGIEPRLLSAAELSDPRLFNASQFDLVVLPTGQSFPASARPALIDFLRQGGGFISTGGYAFEHVLRRVDGKWIGEREWAENRLRQAMEADRSLLANVGFEEEQQPPLGQPAPDGRWRRTSQRCRIVRDEPKQGRASAEVTIPKGRADASDVFSASLAVEPGKSYRITGWMRTREVSGQGMAYLAVYQRDVRGELVEFRDFATARGTTDWQQYAYTFTPKPSVSRITVYCGLYRSEGTAWFDDVRLADVTGIEYRPMNTSSGEPEDGLVVRPEQIGAFDPSFPLRRVCRLRTAAAQQVVAETIRLEGDFRGWAASGVTGDDQARWIPLVEALDRYGRLRGAAGAMVVHYRGFYRGSSWAFFGVENVDLFADAQSPMSRALQQAARFMVRKTFLHNLATDRRFYRKGEQVAASVLVENQGRTRQKGELLLGVCPADNRDKPVSVKREVTVEPGASLRVEAAFPQFEGDADLYAVSARLVDENGRPIDEMTTGFVREQPGVAKAAPRLRFSGNYFTLEGRPRFLFGSDAYGNVYRSAGQNPLTWSEELSAARDMGLNLYENLQYTRPGHDLDENDWRSFLAMAQLTQKHGLTFMPGMLIGHNVAVGDAALAEQSRLCAEYAKRLGGTPAMLYYINGDYQLNPSENPADTKTLWNRWLEAEYRTTDRLRAAWGKDAVSAELGNLDFPPPNTHRWDDAAAVDHMRFLNWLVLRWNDAHVLAVRAHDREHPITSEYYSQPLGGIDLVASIGEQDVSNIGYFDRPEADLDNLPLRIRLNDLRARGKGVSLGEYGVKTHPAWAVANGGSGYHIQRTEEEQKQLFLMVAHYGFGMGASKVQNWCLRDDQERVFPWGIFYPNQVVPKDVAYAHRNQSIVWRHFEPVWRPPRLAVCLANQLRMGNDPSLGVAVATRTFADLLACHFDFQVIDDDHLDRLSPEIKVVLFPSPFALRDEAFQRLLGWVHSGGILLITGDFSYDASRRRTAADRLKELAGVESVSVNYPHVLRSSGGDSRVDFSLEGLAPQTLRPCVRIKPVAAEILGKTTQGEAVLVRATVGRGATYYLADPIELDDREPAKAVRQAFYRGLLRAAGIAPLPIEPDAPWLQVMAQPTARGVVHVVVNTKTGPGSQSVQVGTAAGPIGLGVRNRWPAIAAVTGDGKLMAVGADGKASAGGRSIMEGNGSKLLLSLDGIDLGNSSAILAAPFEPGSLELPRRPEDLVACVGEFRSGSWTTLERLPVNRDRPVVTIDADRATCLILLCRPDEEKRWTDYLSRTMQHPELSAAY